jgi:hypothetical protein
VEKVIEKSRATLFFAACAQFYDGFWRPFSPKLAHRLQKTDTSTMSPSVPK